MPGPSPQMLGVILAALLLLGAGLACFGLHERDPAGTRYVPAQLRDGRIVPGHADVTSVPSRDVTRRRFPADPALAAVLDALPARPRGGRLRARCAGRAGGRRRGPRHAGSAGPGRRGAARPPGCKCGADRARARHGDGHQRPSRLRGHHAAPRRGDRRAPRRGRLDRRLARGRGAARLHHQRHVDDPRRRGVRLFRRRRRTCARAACASSATPPPRIAEDYLRILRFFRFHARYGRGGPDPDDADGAAGGRARARPPFAGARLERAEAHPRRARPGGAGAR